MKPLGLYFSQIEEILGFINFQHSNLIKTAVNFIKKPISFTLPSAIILLPSATIKEENNGLQDKEKFCRLRDKTE